MITMIVLAVTMAAIFLIGINIGARRQRKRQGTTQIRIEGVGGGAGGPDGPGRNGIIRITEYR